MRGVRTTEPRPALTGLKEFREGFSSDCPAEKDFYNSEPIGRSQQRKSSDVFLRIDGRSLRFTLLTARSSSLVTRKRSLLPDAKTKGDFYDALAGALLQSRSCESCQEAREIGS
jgi:hypothetical protein